MYSKDSINQTQTLPDIFEQYTNKEWITTASMRECERVCVIPEELQSADGKQKNIHKENREAYR